MNKILLSVFLGLTLLVPSTNIQAEQHDKELATTEATHNVQDRFEQLSSDLQQFYYSNYDTDQVTIEEYLNMTFIDFYTMNIWQFENPGEIFIVKDFTGLEQFTQLENMGVAFVGDISTYKFDSFSQMSDLRITMIYEPRILSDHATGGAGMKYKYVYEEKYETGIIEFLELFASSLPTNQNIEVQVGAGMTTLPRMYDYSWMTSYLNKGIYIDFMQQDSNNTYYETDYEITYDKENSRYLLNFDIDNPYSSFTQVGDTFTPVHNELGDFIYYDTQSFVDFSLFNSNGEEIKIVEDSILINDENGFQHVKRLKGSFDMETLIDRYYDNGMPVQMGVWPLLSTDVFNLQMYAHYTVAGSDAYLGSSMTLYFELPSLITFETNLNVNRGMLSNEQDLRQFVKNGEKLKEPTIENIPSDQVFSGWYTTADFQEDSKWDFETDVVDTNAYVFSDNYSPDDKYQTPTVLYAKWTPRSQFAQVDYVTNNDTTIPSKLVLKGSLAFEPTDLVKEGYTFDGWYLESSFDNKWNFATDIVNSDITLYAKWNEVPVTTYQVTFVSNGGTPVEPLTGLVANSLIPNQTTTRDGYMFEGWYQDIDLEDEWDFDVDTVNSDITLYAKWNDPSITIPEDEGNTEEEILPKEPVKDTQDKVENTPQTGVNFMNSHLLIILGTTSLVLLIVVWSKKKNYERLK